MRLRKDSADARQSALQAKAEQVNADAADRRARVREAVAEEAVRPPKSDPNVEADVLPPPPLVQRSGRNTR